MTETLTLYPAIQPYVDTVKAEFDQIPQDRQQLLNEFASALGKMAAVKEPLRLVFICTHNSRRSHLSHVWAQVAADQYGVGPVETYSGGTEATAFNPRAVSALIKAGFQITKTGPDDNPRYQVRYSDTRPAITAFSKVYDAEGNPQENFVAVMTCSQADENCPFIPGAKRRVAVNYDDPKEFDGTPQETAKYDERTRQIAREMLYLFSQLKPNA